jgi:hypothetical protein
MLWSGPDYLTFLFGPVLRLSLEIAVAYAV